MKDLKVTEIEEKVFKKLKVEFVIETVEELGVLRDKIKSGSYFFPLWQKLKNIACELKK